MTKKLLSVAAIALAVIIVSCQTEEPQSPVQEKSVSPEVLGQIKALGFSTTNVKHLDEGFLVEGDIVLLASELNRAINKSTVRIADAEQYRTTNLVGAPRVI